MESFRATSSTPENGRGRLSLTGEIDLANADLIVELGTRSLGQDGVAVLAVDLDRVTFMDSTALSALIRLRNVAIEADKQLVLEAVPPRIQRLLEMTGLAGVFASPAGTG